MHGVDVEGKQCGIDQELLTILAACSPLPCTYAGGVRSMEDLELVRRLAQDGNIDITVGSALDCFGGALSYDKVVAWSRS